MGKPTSLKELSWSSSNKFHSNDQFLFFVRWGTLYVAQCLFSEKKQSLALQSWQWMETIPMRMTHLFPYSPFCISKDRHSTEDLWVPLVALEGYKLLVGTGRLTSEDPDTRRPLLSHGCTYYGLILKCPHQAPIFKHWVFSLWCYISLTSRRH